MAMRCGPKAVRHRRDTAIVAAIRAGESSTDIARRYGLTKQRISQIADRAGVVLSFQAEQRRQARVHSAIEAKIREDRRCKRHKAEQAILAEVKAGASIRSASMRHGLSRGEAQTTARKLGLGKIARQHATLQARIARIKRQSGEMRP